MISAAGLMISEAGLTGEGSCRLDQLSLIAVVFVLATALLAPAAKAADLPHHHLSVFAGLGLGYGF